MNIDDKILVDGIIAGDKESENSLFNKYEDRIRFLVRARLRNRVSAFDQDDIVSEARQALLISLRKNGFDPAKGKPLEAYIAGIVSNIVALHFRKLSSDKVNDSIDSQNFTDNQDNPHSVLISQERMEIIESCINNLNTKYREVLVLRIYDEMSIDELSQKLNIEKPRVSERINYALKLLLKEIKKKNYFQYLEQ